MIAEALAACADERCHERQLRAVAMRFGAVVRPIHVLAPAARSLLAMAIENAAEGCARETWAAVVATYQAARIRDPELAAILSRIASDERRHAAFSWKLSAWLETRLEEAERALVMRAYDEAMAELRLETTSPVPDELVRDVGLPDHVSATALLGALDARLRRD